MAKHRHRPGRCRTSVLVLEVLGLATAIVTLVGAILQLL
jgi:membrane-associated PAP2 superfamily phosphatase